MTNPNFKKDNKLLSVPELIQKLWNIYFEMSLDPALEVSAEHLRTTIRSLEQTRKIAFEVAVAAQLDHTDDMDCEDDHPSDGEELLRKPGIQKFGSVMKH